jgi:hypothetical protein
MRIDREECPGCGSEQAFRPQWRYHQDRLYITIFIACTVCPWKRDIEVSTVEIEHQRNRLSRYRTLAHREVEQFGAVQPHTQGKIDAIRSNIVTLRGRHIQGKIWT